MKTEMDYNKAWVLTTASVCATICFIAITIAFSIAFVKAKAFENGYEKATLQGEMGAQWVKSKP
jgi:hypothetical protein